MAEDQDIWRTPMIRQNVRYRIDEAIRTSGNPINKSVNEMENHIFNKAKTKEEYLNLTAKLIIHIKNKNQQSGSQMMGQPAGMMPQPPPQAPSDPMIALQSMAGQQTMNEIPNNNQLHMSNVNIIQGDGSIMTGSGISSNLPTQMQQINMNQQPQFASRTGTMQISRERLMGQQIMMNNGNIPNARPQVLNQNLQMQLRQRQIAPMNNMPMQVQQTGPNMGNFENQQIQGNIQQQQFRPSGPMMNQQQFQGNVNLINSNQINNNLQPPHINQMPGTPQMTNQMMASPSGYAQSPSNMMQHGNLIRQPASVGVPSPIGNVSLNTPANVMMASPNPQIQQQNRVDEQAYLAKLKQLSKYIEPLRMTIARIDQDERYSVDRKKELSKMKNLLEILSDPNRRCPMDTLEKCEQVLERMDFKVKVTEPPPPPQPTVTKIQDPCQPLLDAILNNYKKPLFNHTLQRTFGPAVAAMLNTSYQPSAQSPLIKKQEDQQEIPEVLQGEIARLDSRFKVQLDSLQHTGSKTIYLTCKLDDKDLPCVPAISIKVPDLYPEKPPNCSIDILEYSSSSFFQDVQRNFAANLNKLPEYYSITSLLNSWELSVRQAASLSITKMDSTDLLDRTLCAVE